MTKHTVRKRRSLGFALGILSLCAAHHGSFVLSEELFQTIRSQGIEVSPGIFATIPTPILLEESAKDVRHQALAELAGGNGWEHFSKNSTVAPVAVRMEPVTNGEGVRFAHSIHSAFVTHASLEVFRDKNLLEAIFGKPTDNHEGGLVIEEVKPEEWKSIGIESGGANPIFAYIKFPLLNRVQIEGVLRIEKRETKNSILLTWLMDHRFANGPQHRNSYIRLSENELGQKIPGNPQPYSGCGGYLHIAELESPANSVLIESHLVLHEPLEWFNGSNQLRSKLPISMQESARNFRKKMTSTKR